MAWKFKNKAESQLTNTVIGQGIRMEAAMLQGTGSVRIDGEYYGEINMRGSLTLGETGHIVGNVVSEFALLAGSLSGNINCSDSLHITSTGKVNGNIEAKAVIMDEGASFCGCSKIGESYQSPGGTVAVEQGAVSLVSIRPIS